MRALPVLAAVALMTAPVHAFDFSDVSPSAAARDARQRQVHRARHERRRKPEVRAYVRREPVVPGFPVKVCHAPVRVVGSQWATDAGAEESAQKAWAERVRWEFGEAAMDLNAAQGYQRRCSRSSIGETLGQTLHRCEVSASPCRPAFEDGK